MLTDACCKKKRWYDSQISDWQCCHESFYSFFAQYRDAHSLMAIGA